MFEKLSGALRKTTDKIANALFLDKAAVDGIVRDLQRALIEADVNVSLVMELSQRIKKAAFDERIGGVEKREHLIKVLHDELVKILGTSKEITLGKHMVIMLVGLYGSGKTTTTGKLAAYYAKRGKKVCAVGLDVHRPAAAEQLRQVCEKIHVPAFISPGEKNAATIWKTHAAEVAKFDVVLVDTAGRDALDEDLITEIKTIGRTVQPQETLLVIPADIGQAAKAQAQAFMKAGQVTGVFITRMDSTAKAGGALTACAEVHAPVVFLGVGEKPGDIEPFNPDAFLSRLLGMGDLGTLVEKVRSAMGSDEIDKLQEKMAAGVFTLRDFQKQLDSMQSMGSFDQIMGMIPGMGKVKEKVSNEQLEEQQQKLKRWKYAIDSMTPQETDHPELLEKETSRMQRVAKGAGVTVSDVRALLKQYKLLKEMIHSSSGIGEGGLDQKTMMKFAKKFGKKMRL